MIKNGIDVSRWQGAIDWSRVRTDFAIIQAGYGRELSQKDPQFEANYAGCKAHGIPCGAYWYSYATNADEARKEAAVCLEIIKGKQFEYPIFIDIEEQRSFPKATEITKAFCDELEKAGYFAGIYGSQSQLEAHIDAAVRKRYTVWVAHYGVDKTTYSGAYSMWQKSSTGRIAGISGNVDLDECYTDFPEIIKSAGLNGFPKPSAPEPAPQKHTLEIAELTIDGVTYAGTLTEI